MGFGPPIGFGGANSVTSSRDAGLPHAGVPGHLQDEVKRVLDQEPFHDPQPLDFKYFVQAEDAFTLRSFLGTHKWKLAFAMMLVIGESILLQAGPLLTKFGIDEGVVEKNKGVLVIVSSIYLCSILLHSLSAWYRIRYTGSLGEGLMKDLRVKVFSHLQRQSLDFYTNEKAGVLMTRMTSDIEALSQLFQEGLVNFAVQGLTVIVITIVLLFLNLKLALITLIAVIPITVLLSQWFRSRSSNAYRIVRNRISEVLSDLQESLAGIRVITAHNRREHNVVRHINIVGEHKEANLDAVKAASVYTPGTEAIAIFGRALVLIIGGRMVVKGELEIGELTAFLLYLGAFFTPIQTLTQLYNGYQQGQAAVSKLRDLLGTSPSVPENPSAQPLPEIHGEIVFENVDFSYVKGTPVLKNINLKIEPGETVAVVGPTGGGKSTIAKLATRFYDPSSGKVTIDGFNIRNAGLKSLREQIGVVPQEPFLFAGSIRENVGFSKPEASDTEIIKALEASGLMPMVNSLPDGINTVIHERGASLSAGERQLIAIARAFLSKPRVLVLDEATSNLDLQSESQVEDALDAILNGRSAIIVAHRLATVMRADRILVVDNGSIIESGSHEELINLKGSYSQMHSQWQKSFQSHDS
ncbi:MAG: ABC transporter ATP-binding protein [Acidimicrobiaceae bacterium]|jgi:ATP-binding cassette subfamily B protein|nr:ABC transporter ATP-binding protein [Acidimicrobiaceae bacterium]|tara:strand:- start:78465 stop:80381 length:1917 start_codon:yes stop_codon:yes gene_type:complete